MGKFGLGLGFGWFVYIDRGIYNVLEYIYILYTFTMYNVLVVVAVVRGRSRGRGRGGAGGMVAWRRRWWVT